VKKLILALGIGIYLGHKLTDYVYGREIKKITRGTSELVESVDELLVDINRGKFSAKR